jgi:hypothetical protein
VDLHKRQAPGHEIYRIQSESELRNYVRVAKQHRSKQGPSLHVSGANVASSKAIALGDKYDRLEERLAEWFQSFKDGSLTKRIEDCPHQIRTCHPGSIGARLSAMISAF